MIPNELSVFELKKDETKAFLYLMQNPNQGVGTIAKKTGIPRPSLYGYLKNLAEKGLITQTQKNGIKSFSAVSKEKIDAIFEQKLKEIKENKKTIEGLFLEMKNKRTSPPPKMQIFEGAKEMRHLMNDVLLYKNIETQSYWPIKSVIEILGEDFFHKLNIERIKRNIYVQAIWPQKQKVDMEKYPFMGTGELFARDIRLAPEEINFSMGYWIYENKVTFVSSTRSNFGFIIESEEFVETLRSQYNIIWNLSKPIKVKEEDSKRFYKKMMDKDL